MELKSETVSAQSHDRNWGSMESHKAGFWLRNLKELLHHKKAIQ